VSGPGEEPPAAVERTAWARSLETPLRDFLRTETGSAAVLVAATLAALVWANADASSYDSLWETRISIGVGDSGISQGLREWVNTGLMTLFFFVVGLEARREFDMGELRERRRVALPALACLGGMLLPVAIFLAFNAGEPSAEGWGAVMSSDTAFALGVLALVGPRFSARLRVFLLTVLVVDEVIALLVIATAYTEELQVWALLLALGLFGAVLGVRAWGLRSGVLYLALGTAIWVALFESGVEPIVVGLAMGLLTYAYPAARGDLERATDAFRRFREQPSPQLARSVAADVASTLSPNDRLQQRFHPWTSYAIVPLFALANAGVAIDAELITRAVTSPITLGIAVGYVIGKPAGILGTAWAVTRLSRGRLRPPVGWAAVAGGGTVAGIGFTVSLLISTLAFEGADLEEAKAGILCAAALAAALSWAVFRATDLLPEPRRTRALLGSVAPIQDLAVEVDPEGDHIRGPEDALVTVVEYGDFECPYCGRAERALRDLLAGDGDVRYVWRHLPLTDVHPRAQLAALAAEAAAEQGAFWPMHDLLLERQDALRPSDLLGHAAELGLELAGFERDLREHLGARRIAADVESADLSGVSGTPTFFVNGRRHHGTYDLDSLRASVRAARALAGVAR
jgi:Na+/H+ antiporter NhaA